MAEVKEKQLNTRILLRYDSYDEWVTKDPILKAGEIALATVESNFTNGAENVDGKQKVAANVQSAPTVLIKVGDGTRHYSELQFTSAKAADVYGWAKEPVKPTYNGTEVKIDSTANAQTVAQKFAGVDASILALQQAIGEDGSVAEQIAEAIEEAVKALDSNDAADADEFVTKVILTDGVVSVESAPIKIGQIKGDKEGDGTLTDVIAGLNAAIAAAQAQADAGVAAAGVADGKAVAAQGTADQAILDAAAAQGTADQAVLDAAAAQRQADKGVQDAATADGKAVAAQAAAEAAQGTADQAVQDAADAREVADRAEGKIDAFMDTIEVGGQDVVDTLVEVLDLIKSGDDVATGLLRDVEKAKTDIATNAGAITALQQKDEALVQEDQRLAGLIGDNAEDIAENAKNIKANADKIATIETDYATKAGLKETDDKANANAAAIEVLKTADTTINGRIDGVAEDLAEEVEAREGAITSVTTTITTEIQRVEGLISAEEQRALAAEAGINAEVAKKVETISNDVGITTVRNGNTVTVGIDEDVTFVFNCGNAGSYAN